jgi:gluconokinase
VRYLPDGGVEADPDALFHWVETAIDRCLTASPGAVAAVGTSCFWHSLMGLDAALQPSTPLLMWADTRSAGAVGEFARRVDPDAVRRRTGCRPHSSYLPGKLLWIRNAHPDWWQRTVHWISFGEYLTLRLNGELAASVSMASASGLWDQWHGRWDPEVLDALDLPLATLPPVADLAELPLRQVPDSRWPALAGARWLLVAGDGACNNVGSGAAGAARLALMIGTSGAVRRLQPGGPWTLPPGVWQYRLDRRRGLCGGALSNGGNLHQWLVDVLRLPAGELDGLLEAMVPAAHGLVFLPLLAGERSTGWASGAFGALIGLREATTPLEILRAGLESVALRFAALVEQLGGAEMVIASGGGVWNSAAWAQILADAIGRDLHLSAEAEPSSRGAALLALEAEGLIEDAGALEPPLAGIVRARPDRHARYRDARARMERLYQVLRDDPMIGFGAAPAAPATDRDT